MKDALIVALDSGTSMIKAVAFDLEGRIVAAEGRPNRYDTLANGGVEQDMARTWADAADVLRALGTRVEDLAKRAEALAVTGQGDGTWLVDASGEAVAPAWLWLDSRAAGIVREFEVNGARRAVFELTGCGLNACNQSSHLVWLDRHQPNLLARAASAHHCKDWLYFHLTGRRATDISEGNFTFGNFRTRSYELAILDHLGIGHRAGLLPEMIDGSQETDGLTAEAARATGLPTGIPVSLGYVDVVCTALGAGIYEAGRALGCSIVGSTGMHMRFVADGKALQLAQEPGGYTMTLPIPGAVSQMHSNMAATLNIDWLVEAGREAAGLLGCEVARGEALRIFDARVLEAPPGAALFHPYIHEAGERGPFTDACARAQFTGLSQRVGFIGLLRSIYEGLSFAALDCYRAMGHAPEEVRVAGGAARSPALRRILASALGAPVREVRREESGAAGAAMMAGVAVGVFPDMAAATDAWVTPALGERVLPDPALKRIYTELYPIYVASRKASPPIWAALAAARARGPV
jgi:erythritol kinase (D-erythritol 1-phosphate-forming)